MWAWLTSVSIIYKIIQQINSAQDNQENLVSCQENNLNWEKITYVSKLLKEGFEEYTVFDVV